MEADTKTTTQYQKKTPAEIVRQYKKGLRAKRGLLILIFLLHIIAGIRGIWRGNDGIADVLLKLLILVVITFPISVWISWDFMSLDLILNQACDPVTYVQVMRLLEKVHKRNRSVLDIRVPCISMSTRHPVLCGPDSFPMPWLWQNLCVSTKQTFMIRFPF